MYDLDQLNHIAENYEASLQYRPGWPEGIFTKRRWDHGEIRFSQDPRLEELPQELTKPYYYARLALMDSRPVASSYHLPFIRWSAVRSALKDQAHIFNQNGRWNDAHKRKLLTAWNELFAKLCYCSDNKQPEMVSHGVTSLLSLPLDVLIPYYEAHDLIWNKDVTDATMIRIVSLEHESNRRRRLYISQNPQMFDFRDDSELAKIWQHLKDHEKGFNIDRSPRSKERQDRITLVRKQTLELYREHHEAAWQIEQSARNASENAASKILSPDTPESEYPQKVWDLYHKAFKIFDDKQKSAQPLTDNNVTTILELYQQTGFTRPPRTWAGLLADVYESENHRFTDHNKARELRVFTALRPIGEVEAFRLAQQYFNPPPGGEIDNKRAVFWLSYALNAFDNARDLAIRLINYHNELKPLRVHLPSLVSDVVYDLKNRHELRTDAGRFLARANNAGLYGFETNQDQAHAYYHAVATRSVDWSPEILPAGLKPAKRAAARAAATRSLLGIGTDFYPLAAEAYAEIILEDCDADDINHAHDRQTASRIQTLADIMMDEHQAQQVEEVLTVTRAIISKQMSPQALVVALQTGAVVSNNLLEGCLWLLNKYLDDECVGYPSYGPCIAEVQMRLLGQSQMHPVENQFRYNAIDATNRPILGAIKPPSADGAPIQGFGRFRGFSVTPTGEVNFAFDPANANQLPLLVPEDIEVALALAFGDDKPIWPRFSAEPPAPLTPTSPDWIPFTARWTPQWLGHTALGNTLFATDCEAGPLVLTRIASVQVAPDQQHDPSLTRLRQVIDRMRAVHERHSGHWNFLTFTVAAVELTWSQTDDGALRCAANKSVVGLQTGTFDENDIRTYTNNKDFAGGYRATIFNANYDLFAEHYPLLERYRQLATLVTALNQLRERGFEPAPPIRRAITESYNSLVRRPAPAQASQLFY